MFRVFTLKKTPNQELKLTPNTVFTFNSFSFLLHQKNSANNYCLRWNKYTEEQLVSSVNFRISSTKTETFYENFKFFMARQFLRNLPSRMECAKIAFSASLSLCLSVSLSLCLSVSYFYLCMFLVRNSHFLYIAFFSFLSRSDHLQKKNSLLLFARSDQKSNF